MAFSDIGVVHVWMAMIVPFSFWAPDTFPTWDTVKSVLNQNAVAGLIALSPVVPLSAGAFDLSVGSAMGLIRAVFYARRRIAEALSDLQSGHVLA